MLLAIDIGNTNITCGIFRGRQLVKKFILPTQGYSAVSLAKRLGRTRPQEAVICSVVPLAAKKLNRDLTRLLGRRPYNIGKQIRVPVKNRYRKSEQVGQDRLVNAYAGIRLYGAPLIVVDFGTAVTFDVVSKKGEYLGGLILPGLRISLETLAEKTALLPKINLTRPRELIGRDTKNSMLSGIIYGFAALTDDLALRLKKKIGRNAKVVGTGGNIGLIAKFCRQLNNIDPDLTLKGVYYTWKNFVKNS